jgi:hypothetical protein
MGTFYEWSRSLYTCYSDYKVSYIRINMLLNVYLFFFCRKRSFVIAIALLTRHNARFTSTFSFSNRKGTNLVLLYYFKHIKYSYIFFMVNLIFIVRNRMYYVIAIALLTGHTARFTIHFTLHCKSHSVLFYIIPI